jgi:D-psicose/D-tagatose/L-ribulose 3-epimerase
MFLSMHNWMRPEPLELTIARLARFGYESIEISGEPDRYDTERVRALLVENGIRCWASVSIMGEGRDLIHSNPAVREATVQYLKDCITMVQELDGREMTIVPSQVGKVVPMDTPEQEWRWAVEGLREVYGHAERSGIVIGLEPLNRFETYFLNRHDQALWLAEEVGPHCGVCLDAFHMNIEEADTFGAIRTAGSKLVAFHVADNNRMAPGQGQYDWAKVVATLREVGYNSALTVEFATPVDRTPANKYQDVNGVADDHVAPEDLQFIRDHGAGTVSESMYSWLTDVSATTLREALTATSPSA